MEFILNKLEEINELLQKQRIQQKEILTIEEAKDYLNLSQSRLYKMTSNKEIPYYVPGGKKIYFKRQELDEWIFKSRIAPISEIEQDVEEYLNGTNKVLSI